MSLKSSTIIGGVGCNKRRELDFYPTPVECTVALMNFLKLEPTSIWEPCAGDGAISRVLIEYGHQVLSTDIRMTDYEYCAGGVDYLTCQIPPLPVTITNPPFNIADKIIIKAVSTSNIVAMLLKSQYWHAKKRQDIFNKHTPTYILPLTWRPDFTKGGKGSPTMDMIWTVWIKGRPDKIYQPLNKPN